MPKKNDIWYDGLGGDAHYLDIEPCHPLNHNENTIKEHGGDWNPKDNNANGG